MQNSPVPNSTLAEIYRFALLLTGSIRTAEQVMADTLAEVEVHVDQVRNERGRKAWVVQHIRERCLKNNADVPAAAPRLMRTDSSVGDKPLILKIEAFLLAQRFHALPEPERSALALFYLDFFTIEEIAELLKMSIEMLSETLDAARQLLQQALSGAQKQESTEP